MEKNVENMQDEKLSRALDRLNDGNCPVIADQEIEELIEMAAIVKQTHKQEELPRLLIDKIVTDLAVELGEKKQKGRTQWLYRGLACAAATLLIVIGTQFLSPQSFDKNIAQEIDGSSGMEKMIAVADNSSISFPSTADPITEEPAKEISSEKPPIAELVEETPEKATDSISKVVVEIIQVAQSTPEEEKANQVAILAKEAPPQKAMGENFIRSNMKMSLAANLDNDDQAKAGNVMLVQPDKVAPQSITVDHHSGAIRQVYNEGLEGKIIITQVLIGSEVKTIESASQGGNDPSSKGVAIPQGVYQKDKNNSNSLTVKFDEYWVTIEGNKTMEELQKIVDSLVVKKIEK